MTPKYTLLLQKKLYIEERGRQYLRHLMELEVAMQQVPETGMLIKIPFSHSGNVAEKEATFAHVDYKIQKPVWYAGLGKFVEQLPPTTENDWDYNDLISELEKLPSWKVREASIEDRRGPYQWAYQQIFGHSPED